MQSVVQEDRKAGFELVGGTTQGELGGVAFARTDFKKSGSYLVNFVKACDTQALEFTFYGADRAEVNKLIAATYLKLDLAVSGCGSKARGSPKN
jgi:hypothetical protein